VSLNYLKDLGEGWEHLGDDHMNGWPSFAQNPEKVP